MVAVKLCMNEGHEDSKPEYINKFVQFFEAAVEKIIQENPDLSNEQKDELLIDLINDAAKRENQPFRAELGGETDSATIKAVMAMVGDPPNSFDAKAWSHKLTLDMRELIMKSTLAAMPEMSPLQLYPAIANDFLHAFTYVMLNSKGTDEDSAGFEKLIHRLRQLAMRLTLAHMLDHFLNPSHGSKCPIAVLGIDREELLRDMSRISQNNFDAAFNDIQGEAIDIVEAARPETVKH